MSGRHQQVRPEKITSIREGLGLCAHSARRTVTLRGSGMSSTLRTWRSAGWVSHVAVLLKGKHKPIFAPHVDTGDFVIVINAAKVALSGNKLEQKHAYRHSGYPGGLRAVSYASLMAATPSGPWKRPCGGCCRRTRSAARR